MMQMIVVTRREGIEAFRIVAIAAAWLVESWWRARARPVPAAG